jgi:Kef-type K+ transport system membrane component KefB
MRKILLLLIITLLIGTSFANAAHSSIDSSSNFNPIIYLWLVLFIALSRGLSVIKKIGLPLIVGEILAGVILGDLDLLGIQLFHDADQNSIIKFLAELGAIILMFEIGLESKLSDLRKNFNIGIKLAIYGSIFTFGGGFLISKYLIPNSTTNLNLLIGIICAATATGISAKTFKEMKLLATKEVKIVLVSSVLDEVLSIVLFGIISSMILDDIVNFTNLSTSIIQVIGFFGFAAICGQWITPLLTKWSTKIHAGMNMKIGVLLGICFFFSWLAYQMGLATVIGAFIAGLILDEIYFKSFSRASFFNKLSLVSSKITDPKLQKSLDEIILIQERRNLEEMLKPLAHVFVPMFFIYIGLLLDIKKLLHVETLIIIAALVIVSFTGRIIAGFMLREKKVNKLILGLGMTPIGEAGLIFAMFGKNIGLINSTTLAAIVAALVISAISAPIFIKIAVHYFGVNRVNANNN